MKNNMERRTITFTPEDFEIRSKPEGGYVFRGHASVFNSWSQDLGGFVEQVGPTAFNRALAQGQDVRHLINHDPNLLLGRTTSGTTRLSVDERGLHVETDLPNTSYANDLIELQKRGDMTQMSFGFMTPEGGDSWDWSQEPAQRTLNDVDLADVSSVTYPAYADTSSVVSEEIRSMVAANVEAWRETDARAGAMLSRVNMDHMKAAADHINTVLAAAEPDGDEDQNGRDNDMAASDVVVQANSQPLEFYERRLMLSAIDTPTP